MEDYAPNVSSMDIRRSGTMERKNSAHKKFGPPLNANISAIASEDIRMPNLSPPIINSPSQSLIRCSKSIALAVEMFATVGETICDQNREIHGDMQDACAKSRSFCESLEKNCDRFHRQVFTALETTITSMRRHSYDRHDFQGELNKLTHNASCLLATMTRILLLADSIMVKEVLVSKDMTMPHGENALTPLGQLHHFTEFVKAFSDFGVEMIRFCILIVSMRKNRLSMSSQSLSFATEMQERRDGHYCRQVQIEFAQNILERSSVLLLSSSSTVQSHPESGSARENRDTVFCQMRRALDLIHYIIKDGVMHCGLQLRDDEGNSIGPIFNEDDSVVSPGAVPTVMQSIECFVDAVTIMQMSLVSESYKDHLFNTLDGIIESIQDFTDSAHTKHERRQTILMLCEKAKDELSRLLGDISEDAFSGLLDISSSPQPPSRDVEDSMRALRATTDNLRLELQEIAVEHSFLLGQVCDLANAITSSLMESAIQGDFEQLEYYSVQFSATLVSIEEISKVIRNAFVSDVLNVQTKHAEINLKIFGPQIIIAAQTLIHHPHSKAAHHNLECFCTLWKSLANELMLGCKQVQGDGIFFGNHLKLPSLDHGGAPMIVEQPPTPTTVTNPSPYVNFHPSLGNSLQFPDCSSNLVTYQWRVGEAPMTIQLNLLAALEAPPVAHQAGTTPPDSLGCREIDKRLQPRRPTREPESRSYSIRHDPISRHPPHQLFQKKTAQWNCYNTKPDTSKTATATTTTTTRNTTTMNNTQITPTQEKKSNTKHTAGAYQLKRTDESSQSSSPLDVCLCLGLGFSALLAIQNYHSEAMNRAMTSSMPTPKPPPTIRSFSGRLKTTAKERIAETFRTQCEQGLLMQPKIHVSLSYPKSVADCCVCSNNDFLFVYIGLCNVFVLQFVVVILMFFVHQEIRLSNI
ncbi:alpha-catulin-like isoform X2 [Tigriopus californicus]|uniref:alpha-catulin-like isoform X2 n=1 Tax=Tigriopus californicus TaxID=6832 RepID=UPI0027DA6384|nr:alpha-catulin-like isoform X2 [Tigriopus californicus]